MPYLFLFVWLSFCSAGANASLAARVNGEVIDESEVVNEANKDSAASNRDDALNRLILFRLAVQSAKSQGLDKSEKVKKEIDKVLYKAFIESELATSPEALNISDVALKKYYETKPQIRLRHLVIVNPKDHQKIDEVLEQLKKGTDFKELVLKYSQDVSAKMAGGDLDYRGPQNLPPELYKVGITLKKNEVSKPIAFGGGVHLIQLTDRQPFPKASSSYLEYLRSGLKQERSEAIIMGALNTLKQKAKIEKALPGPEEKK